MDFSKVGQGQRIAAIAGALLLIDLWMSWYSIDIGNIPGATQALVDASGIDTSATAWQAFSYTDLLLAITAVIAVASAVVPASGAKLQLPVSLSTLTTGLGGVMTLLVLYRIINQPGQNDRISVEWGAYLGLLLVAAVAYGGMRSQGDPAPTTPTTTSAPPPPAPPTSPPPPPAPAV